jgi:hypothetical protein
MVSVAALAGLGTAVAATAPLVATFLMLLVVTQEGRDRSGWAGRGLHKLGLRTWPLALLAPIAIFIIVGGAVAALAGAAHRAPTRQAMEYLAGASVWSPLRHTQAWRPHWRAGRHEL